MYCLFFNEEKHKLRLGPFLWMFSVNIMVMMSTMGWGIVYLLANEKTIPKPVSKPKPQPLESPIPHLDPSSPSIEDQTIITKQSNLAEIGLFDLRY